MNHLHKILLGIPSWSAFFDYSKNLSKKEKGDLFEKLTELIFKTKSVYKSRFKNVWLLSEGIDLELRNKLNLPKADEGIDLIAENYTGTFCAIQCKFKGAHESPTRKDIATFLDLSRNHCKNITEQILAHTGTNGIKKTELLPDSFTQIGLDFWSQLTEEDWVAIQLFAKDEKTPIVKRIPRPHQQDAITASKKYFLTEKNTKGKLIMPCGTGKSLTAFWITQALASRTTIIAVPSLALLKQSLEDWTKEMLVFNEGELPEWCCICSDESAGKISDNFVTDTYSLGIPTTTNEYEISAFLERISLGGKVIFTTYQSADKLAQVSQRLKFRFDLAILDEAHKTVGAKDKAFSILLKEDKISIGKRLFMTATERIVKGAEDDILSMDDEKVYGKVFYKLSFKKAIEEGIITDYKIVTVLVNDTEIQGLIKKNKYVTDHGKKVDEAEAQMLTTAIALKKAIKEYNLTHTVSFHKSINASKEFQSLYQKIDTTADSPTVFHISSKLNAGARAELLNDFKNTRKAIITNARCLTEGVDVPAIDCVLFADQKQSVIDIVQASGRALRQYTDKKTGVKKEIGYIIIPVILKENESLDDLTDSDRFKTVARIITSLSTQDETIAEELKLIDAGKQKAGSGKIQVIGVINKSIKLDLSDFSLKIITKIWERVAKVNWRPYNECIEFTRTLGLRSVRDWYQIGSKDGKPLDIPSKPHIVFASTWAVSGGWNDWLGTNNKNNWNISKNKFSYEEAKEFLKSNCKGLINSMTKFNNWKNGRLDIKSMPQFPDKMPRNPINTYIRSNEWVNNYDFFGTEPKKTRTFHRPDFKLIKISYNELKALVKEENLNSRPEYKKWLEGYKNELEKRGYYAPVKVESYASEFEGWAIFLNSKSSRSVSQSKGYIKMNFKDAKSFVQKLKLNSKTEWYNYIKGEIEGKSKLPIEIPRNPSASYSKDGWISWSDWLSKNQ